MAAGIFAVAPQFVSVILGDQWHSAIPLMQVLAVWGGLRAFGANVGSVYKATGRPDIETRIQALQVIIIALIIYPAADWFGVVGVASTIVISSFLPLPIHLHYVLSIIQGRATKILKLIAYPLVSSIAMAGCVVILDAYILTSTNMINLLFLIIFGTLAYITIMVIFEYISGASFIELYYEVKQRV
jgi:O-antigen/teichoic acid export membrane protein